MIGDGELVFGKWTIGRDEALSACSALDTGLARGSWSMSDKRDERELAVAGTLMGVISVNRGWSDDAADALDRVDGDFLRLAALLLDVYEQEVLEEQVGGSEPEHDTQ